MAEDLSACTYVRHHKHKLLLILSAMRSHAQDMRAAGFTVNYRKLDEAPAGMSFTQQVSRVMADEGLDEIVHFEIEDASLEKRIAALANERGFRRTVLPSPMFLCTRNDFADWMDNQRAPRMQNFYQWQRKQQKILLTDDMQAVGGRWSFDAENRKKLPRSVPVPALPLLVRDQHVDDVARLVARRFPDHAGDTKSFALPTTHKQADAWLTDFIEQRFTCFGDYEDALTTRSDHVFHSVLSPLMNIGLLTPRVVVNRVLAYAEQQDVAINNVEGFIRQVIGWREFMRGIYQHSGHLIEQQNFWNHERRLTRDWYDGTTGILPLDLVIDKANRIGWAHHIERLMVVGNLMLLAEIHPKDAYRWFMEMFVDATNWVMVANVYSMALYADGGMITTKPYICGSNYLLRMGDYSKGSWSPVVDGLFWRFIAKHRMFFNGQPRLSMMVRNLDQISDERRASLAQYADSFLASKTQDIKAAA